jgi:hypothetical protein
MKAYSTQPTHSACLLGLAVVFLGFVDSDADYVFVNFFELIHSTQDQKRIISSGGAPMHYVVLVHLFYEGASTKTYSVRPLGRYPRRSVTVVTPNYSTFLQVTILW